MILMIMMVIDYYNLVFNGHDAVLMPMIVVDNHNSVVDYYDLVFDSYNLVINGYN